MNLGLQFTTSTSTFTGSIYVDDVRWDGVITDRERAVEAAAAAAKLCATASSLAPRDGPSWSGARRSGMPTTSLLKAIARSASGWTARLLPLLVTSW